MGNKRIVYLPSDDESDDDDPTGPSFISGAVISTIQNKMENYSENLTTQINVDIKETFRKKEKMASSTDFLDFDEEQEIIAKQVKRKSKDKKANESVKSLKKNVDADVPIVIKEVSKTPSKSAINSFDESFDADDEFYKEYLAKKEAEPIKIKMKRLNRIERFSILRTQPISAIFDEVGQKFNIPVSNIILYLNDNLVDPKSSPKSLELSVADIFEVLARVDKPNSADSHDSTANDRSFVTLQLRDNTKKKLTIRINRFKLVRDLAEHYAKEKDVNIENLVLEFDSDKMEFDKKIDYFEMDDDDQIDIIVKS